MTNLNTVLDSIYGNDPEDRDEVENELQDRFNEEESSQDEDELDDLIDITNWLVTFANPGNK